MSSVIDEPTIKQKRTKKTQLLLERFYNNENTYEIAIDEVGRGCLFGRVYIACVILPKDPELFSGQDIKDSKKFSSKKKLFEVAEYIKSHAYAWHVTWVDEKTIDEINILQSTMRGMHHCIREIMTKTKQINTDTKNTDFMAVIDGNYFNPYRIFDDESQSIYELPFITIEQGDAKYMSIAAASILAKTHRDEFVLAMHQEFPHYEWNKNKTYGTAAHRSAIERFGLCKFHRKSFKI